MKGRNRRKDIIPPVLSHEGKLPPQALDLEEAVLGAIMLERNAFSTIADILTPEVFYKDAHNVIFEACHRLFMISDAIDILTVTEELRKMGMLERAGGAYYITQLTNRLANAANIEYHARIIKERYVAREMIRLSIETTNLAYEDTTDVFAMVSDHESKLMHFTRDQFKKKERHISSLYKENVEAIESSMRNEDPSGLMTGFKELDRVLGGLQPGNLIVLAARPGQGKTAFALCVGNNVAKQKIPVGIFSIEMSSMQVVNRLTSIQTGIPLEYLKKKRVIGGHMEGLMQGLTRSFDCPIYIDDTPALKIFEFRAKAIRMVRDKKVKLIIVDYMQLMESDEDDILREQEISYISRSLKGIAKELEVPVLALSQLSRKVEDRVGKKPQLSDLRESGAIEQDADIVLFLMRPEYYNIPHDSYGNAIKKGYTELGIGKNRDGATGDVIISWEDKCARFVNENEYAEVHTASVKEVMNELNADNEF